MKYIPLILVIALCLLISNFVFGFQTPKKDMNNPFDYEKAWSEIDSLFKVYQYKNIGEPLEKVYTQAKANQDKAQLIKAIHYKAKLIGVTEEDAIVLIKQFLEKELTEATFPNDAILHSMLGSYFFSYAESNYWRIWENTAVDDTSIVTDDIATWDMRRLIDRSFEHYNKSVENKKTFDISIEEYKVLLNDERESTFLRPTLYDALAHRAYDFYAKDKNYLITPAYQFEINQSEAFGSMSEFVNADFKEVEKFSSKHRAILLLQDLLRIHMDDEKPDALVDANLKRLAFVNQYSTIADKQNLYLDALYAFRKQYLEHEVYSEITAYIGDIYHTKGSSYSPFGNTDNKWDWKYAFERYEEGIVKFPDSYGAKMCQNKQARLMQKNLAVGTENVLIPNNPSLVWLTFRNIPHVYLKVIPVTDELKNILSKDGTKPFIEAANKVPHVQLTEFDVPNDGDLHQHKTEFKLDGLAPGEYYLMVSNNEYFSYEYQAVSYTFLTVSNLAYFVKNREGKNDFYVVDRASGEPQKDVKAEFFSRKYNSKQREYEYYKVGEDITDNFGKASVQDQTTQYFYPKFTKGKDILDLRQSHYDYTPSEKSSQMFTKFFLDRKIYRPGQTVFFKGIVINKNPKDIPSIVPNQKTKVTFYDANGQVVAEKEFTTNEYGTFNGSFAAPSSGLTGQMRIGSNIGGYYDASISFRVEEYKRPKFEMAFNPIEGSYSLNDEVTVSGFAKAFAGNNIDGAKVNYRVVRKTSYPYWRWWMWGNYPTIPDTEIINGETTTDENGVFKVTFKALPDASTKESNSPLFTYEIMADVIDITGETHSSSTYVSAGYIALQANISVPAEVNKAKLKSFPISTTNLNGNFEPATGTITITPLITPDRVFRNRQWQRPDVHMLSEEDYIKNFKGIPYLDENEQSKWKKGETLLTYQFNTAQSKELNFETIDTKNWTPGIYELVLKTQDKNGKSIEIVKNFKIFDLKSKEIVANATSWFHFENKNYEPNSTAELFYGSAYKNPFVLYERYGSDGSLEHSQWVNVKNIRQFPVIIKESDRGGIGASFTFVMDNRGYTNYQKINVPWTNKELNIEYQTFRDKLLPGQEEEWRIKVSGAKKEKVAAEIAATMYDASLDVFMANSWSMSLYPNYSPNHASRFMNNFSTVNSNLVAYDWQPTFPGAYRQYPVLDIGLSTRNRRDIYLSNYSVRSAPMMSRAVSDSAIMEEEEYEEDADGTDTVVTFDPETFKEEEKIVRREASGKKAKKPSSSKEGNKEDFSNVKVRTNLNETVFFMPDLKTDENGDVIISFTMNEALTRWKLLLMAHTKELETAFSTKTVVTQKDLMVQPNPPRFFRENDVIELSAKVSNLSENDLTGSAKIELFDALTMNPINVKLGVMEQELPFTAKKGQSAPLSWKLTLPDEGLSAITYRVIAVAGNFSDGEENTKPVLTNRMLLTETMPMTVRGEQTKTFEFKAIKKAENSKTLKHHQATLEFTSNPAWYAVQALPYMMEYPYECTEQVFSRYYSNSLAASVTNSHPKVKSVFDQWKSEDFAALESNLTKNQELKYALLEETPWVFAAQDEAKRRKEIALLFDLNRMEKELSSASKKIADRQLSNGGFAWFPGGEDSWYITQYLVEGMGHLDHLGVNKTLSGVQSVEKMDAVVAKAVSYIDDKIVERYNLLAERIKESEKDEKTKLKWEDNHLSYMDIHFLYARSFYKDLPMSKETKKVHDYFLGQAKTYWTEYSVYSRGLMALALYRNDETAISNLIVEGFRQSAQNDEEKGMYWNYNAGYYWYQMPIESHALMIEVFSEVANDKKAVEDLKLWLLKNKQTTHWKTTKATAAAVYALLMNGDNWLMEDQDLDITVGYEKVDQSNIKKEAGTGQFKVRWEAEDVNTAMSEITVANPNKSPAWGAFYWQYFEDLDQVTEFKDTPLKIEKKLFREENTSEGPVLKPITAETPIKVGDKIKVRIELKVDRNMEYVHMKDMRASGFEPINVMSQYKWQNGLGYYESTRDAATNFFFSYLPKGTYVFEYPLRATFKGDFSNGITTIQCMYAPEFTAHSEGIRVTIEE